MLHFIMLKHLSMLSIAKMGSFITDEDPRNSKPDKDLPLQKFYDCRGIILRTSRCLHLFAHIINNHQNILIIERRGEEGQQSLYPNNQRLQSLEWPAMTFHSF